MPFGFFHSASGGMASIVSQCSAILPPCTRNRSWNATCVSPKRPSLIASTKLPSPSTVWTRSYVIETPASAIAFSAAPRPERPSATAGLCCRLSDEWVKVGFDASAGAFEPKEIRFADPQLERLGIEMIRPDDLRRRVSARLLPTPERAEFFMVLRVTQGELHHTVDFHELRLSAGSLLFVFPGLVQHWHVDRPAQGCFVMIDPPALLPAVDPPGSRDALTSAMDDRPVAARLDAEFADDGRARYRAGSRASVPAVQARTRVDVHHASNGHAVRASAGLLREHAEPRLPDDRGSLRQGAHRSADVAGGGADDRHDASAIPRAAHSPRIALSTAGERPRPVGRRCGGHDAAAIGRRRTHSRSERGRPDPKRST